MLKENYEEVRSRIDNACVRTGRNPEDVTLIAVSKTKPLSSNPRSSNVALTDSLPSIFAR